MDLQKLILDKVSTEPMSGCWLWEKSLTKKGYGHTWDGEKVRSAHRLSYEAFKGPIPEGLQLDHKCRTRSCVNPDHLEAVTPQENTLRSPIAPCAVHSRKTHCPNGHALVEGNLHMPTLRRGSRRCLICRRAQHQDRKRRVAVRKKGGK